MSYTINKTDGTQLAVIADGTLDTTTSLDLAGRNFAGYGEFLNENLVQLLENFANATSPRGAIDGQIWYNTASKTLQVKSGASFKTLASISTSIPTSPATGDFWYDTYNDQVKIFNGINWTLVGPMYSKTAGQSGAIPEVVVDTLNNPHVVIKLLSGGITFAIISKDSTFTPLVAIPGFTTIKPGYNITAGDVSIHKFYGTAANADLLGSVAPTTYLRKDQDATISANAVTGTWGNVRFDGEFSQGNITTIHSDSLNTIITNQANGANISLVTSVAGAPTTIMTISGGVSADVRVRANPTADLGVATKQYVDVTSSNLQTQINNIETELGLVVSSNVGIINTRLLAANSSIANTNIGLTAANAAILLKANIASPALTGTPSAPTAAVGTNTTQLATTEFVLTQDLIRKNWTNANITSNISALSATLTSAIDLRATSSNPVFTGTPIAPTAAAGTNTTQIATTEFVRTATQLKSDTAGAYWQGSRKYVSTSAPASTDGLDGDIWFQYQ